MSTVHTERKIDLKDKQVPVNIHVDEGGSATINVDITNCYNSYSYPDWFDREMFEKLLAVLGGRGGI